MASWTPEEKEERVPSLQEGPKNVKTCEKRIGMSMRDINPSGDGDELSLESE